MTRAESYLNVRKRQAEMAAEQCKDAINFSEFIDRIEVSHEDLENNAELGFVNGISKIIIVFL